MAFVVLCMVGITQIASSAVLGRGSSSSDGRVLAVVDPMEPTAASDASPDEEPERSSEAARGADTELVVSIPVQREKEPSRDVPKDPWLTLRYGDRAGETRLYDGRESEFDWRRVARVMSGWRDGRAMPYGGSAARFMARGITLPSQPSQEPRLGLRF